MKDLIAAHPFAAQLSEAHIAAVAGCARNAAFAPGAFILREGQPADSFHLIRQGHVATEVYAPRGGSHVLGTLGPDEILGVSWIVPPYRWTTDARAIDHVHSFAFDAVCLRGKCEADPALGYALMKQFMPVLVRRLSAARMQALDLYGSPA